MDASPAFILSKVLGMRLHFQFLHKVVQTHKEDPSSNTPPAPLPPKFKPCLCCVVEVRQSRTPSGKENPAQISKSSEVWASVRPEGWFRRVAQDKAPEVRDHRVGSPYNPYSLVQQQYTQRTAGRWLREETFLLLEVFALFLCKSRQGLVQVGHKATRVTIRVALSAWTF